MGWRESSSFHICLVVGRKLKDPLGSKSEPFRAIFRRVQEGRSWKLVANFGGKKGLEKGKKESNSDRGSLAVSGCKASYLPHLKFSLLYSFSSLPEKTKCGMRCFFAKKEGEIRVVPAARLFLQ